MKEQFFRTGLLLGKVGLERLQSARVIVFGVGGVGSFCVEALTRAGVGHLTLVDPDNVDITNLNRQLQTDTTNVGQGKAQVMAERLRLINPNLILEVHKEFYLPENRARFHLESYDYLVDCIDTITSKIDLATFGAQQGIPVISAMGAGNKLDPTAFRVGDVYDTSVDPIAKVMRRELKKRGVMGLKVVYSLEHPVMQAMEREPSREKVGTIGSVSFVPSVVGLIMAGEIIKDLANSLDN